MKKRNFLRDSDWQWLKLSGKTRHGKCRIDQHGVHWLVQADGLFNGQPAWLHLCARLTVVVYSLGAETE